MGIKDSVHPGTSNALALKVTDLSKKEAEYKNTLIKYYHGLAHKRVIISVKSPFVKSTISELIITGIIFNVSKPAMLLLSWGNRGKRDGLKYSNAINSKRWCFAYVLKSKC